MAPFMLISALVTSYMCVVQGQTPCNKNGTPGTCINLYSCEPLMKIVTNPSKSQEDIELLRKSQCGFEGQTPKVCCSAQRDDSCVTADRQQGKCVGLYSCAHIVDMLKPPVSQEALTFMQNSKCEGPEQYNVCCGPPPTKLEPAKFGACTPSHAPPDPRSKCCGFDSMAGDRIVGGNATSVDQYPWLVIIEYVKNNKIKLLCGGTLISGRYVLTAGHCLVGPVLDAGRPINVRIGEYDTANNGKDCVETPGGGVDCTDGALIIPIEEVIAHPQYDPNAHLRRNDIGLIRLRETAPFTDFIRPICLPTSDITLSPPENFTLFAAGWGAVSTAVASSNIKLHVDLPFRSKDECQPPYRLPRRNITLWEGQLCAGGVTGKDSCRGDSGGPLMYENGKFFEVIGIVSFGPTPCGMPNVPGVYTKVFEYDSWIRTQIRP